MSKTTIEILSYTSLVLGLIFSVIAVVWWYIKIRDRLNKSVESSRTINEIGMKSLFYNLPSLIALCIFMIPTIYFFGKLKQFNYCKDVIKVNSKSSIGFNENSPDFIEDCGCYNLEELKKEALK
ncbi:MULTISPECIES: hypothetical protein [unclassified Cellulophaga]|uniref:hypothetical protein n=1 Tax=unclassified Cellulophaga TaxID=2634405 RepID=UPI0026E18CB9|nr:MULTISPECIES: hypothetical protein [unclassified Cellulophaga]MDO6489872.1 hypothetical protein [Cellulophaga sp. 2_MG-2023]MDO6494934.1 hypothetical protein [Cellulophaga sp. 3_MG-2023]